MINAPAPRFPAQPNSWNVVTRLCRRICLLRECGQATDADILTHGALAEALAEIRATSTGMTTAELDQRVEATFAAETERVANAAVLAELLAPLVTQQLQSAGALVPQAVLRETPTAVPPGGAPFPAHIDPARKPARASAASIADFIDEMITQERAAPPDRPSRRAS